MFNKTLNFSEIKTSPESFSQMNGNDVFQIFHRGSEVKVMMTQEHYFDLLQKIERLEGDSRREQFNSEQLLEEVKGKLNLIDDFIKKESGS